MNLRSFETPRRRRAPESWRHRLGGNDVDAPWTLVVSLKANCESCQSFSRVDPGALVPLRLVLVSRESVDWTDFETPVRVDPELVEDLQITGAPYYAVIDSNDWVVAEGAVFDVHQILAEVLPLLV
ncbi:MAG: hypothetical protein HKL87_03030 [Acidimicrobiaceae bacterium]|nr:hypothetical protein [Acidimicrobiaceae bacterium]